MKNCMLIITLHLFSLSSMAMAPLEQHMIAVSQGMSAFYMYLLSDGDEKYIRQFNQYQLTADSVLREMTDGEHSIFSRNWQSLKTKLGYQYLEGEGVFFERVSRIEYRDYLTSLYLHYKEASSTDNSNLLSIFNRIQVLSSLLAARALDVVSDDFGQTGLTEHDLKLNPSAMAQQIAEDIDLLLAKNLTETQLSILRKVSSKFHFIKNTIVDYNSVTAYFLIYGNMKSMNKLLNKKLH